MAAEAAGCHHHPGSPRSSLNEVSHDMTASQAGLLVRGPGDRI